jgi:hypothetical protein
MYLTWYDEPDSSKAALIFLGVLSTLPLIHDECGSFKLEGREAGGND